MTKEDAYLEKLGKYNHAGFTVEVDPNFPRTSYEKRGLSEMKEALQSVGVTLKCESGKLSMKMDAKTFINVATRKAGPKRKQIAYPSHKDNKGFSVYYSDIVFMMQTMSDKEIMDELNIPKATYYRHKKTMLESDYYKALDTDKLDDEEYLKSVDFDNRF